MSRVLRRAAIVAAALVGVYTFGVMPRWLHVIRLRAALPGLPKEWEGVRIAQLSDFHAGGWGVPLRSLRHARQVAEQFRPDLIALTGDYWDDGRPTETDGLFAGWPSGVPVVGVLGNHDDRDGPTSFARLLAELDEGGVRLLRNEALRIELRGRPAWVVGVDDPHSWQADEERAFAALPPGEEALLYLAHSPAAAATLEPGRARLMLSGHTHGGQFRLAPSGRIPAVKLVRRLKGGPERRDPELHRGWHWVNGAVLVISNGLGVSQVPGRFRARPQVILIELARAPLDGPPCDDVARYVSELHGTSWWSRLLS